MFLHITPERRFNPRVLFTLTHILYAWAPLDLNNLNLRMKLNISTQVYVSGALSLYINFWWNIWFLPHVSHLLVVLSLLHVCFFSIMELQQREEDYMVILYIKIKLYINSIEINNQN